MLSNEFFDFFTGLTENNSKVWFDANRSAYEEYVKAPFKVFTQQLIDRIRTVDPTILPNASDVIFRINRDIRFAKDKTPYKTSMGGFINRFGRKAIGLPGFYFEVSATGGGVAGGSYRPEREQLERIRDLLMHEGPAFRAAVSSKEFTSRFGEVQGERSKIVPAEFKKAAANESLIYNKQLYWWAEIKKAEFKKPAIVDTLVEYYMAQRPAQVLLESALYD